MSKEVKSAYYGSFSMLPCMVNSSIWKTRLSKLTAMASLYAL